jgi:hypothetical protein
MMKQWIIALAAAVVTSTGYAAAQGATQAELRLQQVADKQEIIELLLEYGRTLDRKDYEAYGKLFAREGEWAGGGAPAKGPKAIEERMRKTFGPGSGVKWTTDFHVLTNPIVKVEGDRATAWSRWLFMSPGADGKPVPAYGGHYDDVLVREDGVWRFQRREVVADMPAPGGAR